MLLKHSLCLLVASVFAISARTDQPLTIRVAAAADLQYALAEVAKEYMAAHPTHRIEPVFGSSGQFAAQIAQGAPFDLFLSADEASVHTVAKVGKTSGAPFRYATGRLVLWVKSSSKLDLNKGLACLIDPSVHQIAIGHPVHAPYGHAAVDALHRAGIWEKIESKLVIAENASQTLQFAQSGAADVGIVAQSLARAPLLKGQGRMVEVPATLHQPLNQTGVVIASSAHAEVARSFADFLQSERGRKILADYGLGPPGK